MQYVFPHPWGEKKLLNSIATKLGYLTATFGSQPQPVPHRRRKLVGNASPPEVPPAEAQQYQRNSVISMHASVACISTRLRFHAPIEPSLLNLPSYISNSPTHRQLLTARLIKGWNPFGCLFATLYLHTCWIRNPLLRGGGGGGR